MQTYLHFNAEGVFVAKTSNASGNEAYSFPVPEGKEVGERFSVIDGQLVDSQPEMTDDEFTLWFAEQAAAQAELAQEQARVAIESKLTKIQFADRFTAQELAGIYTAAKENVLVEIFLDKMKMVEFIDLSDVRTIEGVMSLEAAGLIAEGRASEILEV